jgi:hypothetical protein
LAYAGERWSGPFLEDPQVQFEAPSGLSLYIRLSFAHVPRTVSTQDFCRRLQKLSPEFPTGVSEFPFQSIVVVCALCGDERRYLPSEVFLGRIDQLVIHQRRMGAA